MRAGVTFLAATGDYGAPGQYPAFSRNVAAVGGTVLTRRGRLQIAFWRANRRHMSPIMVMWIIVSLASVVRL